MNVPVRAPSWAQRLTWAVTGSLVGASEAGVEPDPASAAQALLEAAGWDAAAVHRHAAERRADERPWPHPLPDGWLGPGEHARYQALLQLLLSVLREPGRRPTSAPGGLSPRERQLMADRPPHW